MPEIIVTNKKNKGFIHESPVMIALIHRPNILGNPYKIGPDGNRTQVIDAYEELLRSKMNRPNAPMRAALLTIYRAYWEDQFNIYLEYFCAPLPCHGDVIKRIILKHEILM
jgi:hypothetical protein